MRAATIKYSVLGLFILIQGNLFSQTNSFPFDDWIKKLGDKKGTIASGISDVLHAIKDRDSATVISILNNLERKGRSSGLHFNFRFLFLKAEIVGQRLGCSKPQTTFEAVKNVLDVAYEMDNDSFVSATSWHYGGGMYQCKVFEFAAMYCLSAAEMDENSGRLTPPDNFRLLGDVLYITRDYEKSIYYTRKAIITGPVTSYDIRSYNMSLHNTIGLCWQKLGKFDSAFYHYQLARQLAHENKNVVWDGIISGNMGQIYFVQRKYDTAKALLYFDYRESKAHGETASAANSLQWIARINLIQGKQDSAITQLKEALHMLENYVEPRPFYLQNVYYAITDAYRSIGQQDSVFKYSQLYNVLRDSIERAVANSRLEIARIKLDNQQHVLAIRNLNKEKEIEKQRRNFIVAIIILVAIIVMFYINRLRLKHRHNEQLALQQKAVAEAEVEAANTELNLFKKNIIEKTGLIEKLQKEVDENKASIGQQQIIDELTNQTILTEDDWEKFKSLFEKINPRFFTRLKEKSPDITVAEQRMAALMRLQLSSKQIASMLGISIDSVRKTRLRLRHRLGVSVDEEVEHILNAM